MLVLFCSLQIPLPRELNVVDNVDQLPHHRRTQQLTLSLQSKLDALEARLHNLDSRSVHSFLSSANNSVLWSLIFRY